MMRSGMTAAEIGAKFGVSKETIRSQRAKIGFGPEGRITTREKQVPADKIATVKSLLADGRSVRWTARNTGVGSHIVGRIRDENNFPVYEKPAVKKTPHSKRNAPPQKTNLAIAQEAVWTPAFVAEIDARLQSGESMRNVAASIGLNKNQLSGVKTRLGFGKKPVAHVTGPTAEENRAMARTMLERGASIKDVAKAAHISRDAAILIREEVHGALLIVPRVTLPPLRHCAGPLLEIMAEPAPFIRVRSYPPVRARQCCAIEGETVRDYVRCEHDITRGSYCAHHAALFYAVQPE
jgi:DNA invertase Pin-like site-specific DNA recombinase